jgi:hypothetical protein
VDELRVCKYIVYSKVESMYRMVDTKKKALRPKKKKHQSEAEKTHLDCHGGGKENAGVAHYQR